MTQIALQTEPNSGLPAGLTRKRPTLDELSGMLDAEPKRTLYVNRPLKNAAELIEWARSVGFKKTLPASDMHVTLAFSKTPVAWGEVNDAPDAVVVPMSPREIEPMGDEGAVVLRFESGELQRRWQDIKNAGAVWDYPTLKPHVTITYDAGDFDFSKVEPFTGVLEFGPEDFDEVSDKRYQEAKASLVGDEALSYDAVFSEGDHPRDHGKFSSGSGGSGGSEKDKGPVTVSKAGSGAGLPFVQDFIKKHGTMREQSEYLDKQPVEKLQKALDLIEKHKAIDPGAKHVKDMIEKSIKGRKQAGDSALVLALDKDSVRTIDKEGRLHVAEANICKACISPYKGQEIMDVDPSLKLEPAKIYYLLRPPEELEKAAATSNGIQILRKHIAVNAEDHQPWDVVGAVGTSAEWESPYVKTLLRFGRPMTSMASIEKRKLN